MFTESEMRELLSRMQSSFSSLFVRSEELNRAQDEIETLKRDLDYQTDRANKAEIALGRTDEDLQAMTRANDHVNHELNSVTDNRNWWREQSNKFESEAKTASSEAEGLRYEKQHLEATLAQVKQVRDAYKAKVEAMASVFRGVLEPTIVSGEPKTEAVSEVAEPVPFRSVS